MKNRTIGSWCVLVLVAVSSVGLATPYYGWMSEYDGTESGTMAYWSFNADTQGTDSGSGMPTAADVSGNGNTAYIDTDDSSKVYFSSVGKWGDSVFTNGGIDQIVKVPSIGDSFFSAGQSLSLEAWVKFDDLSVDRSRYIISTGYPNSTDGRGFAFYMNGDTSARFYFATGKTSSQRIYTSDIDWVESQWYHVAATWNADTDTLKIFRDGEELKSLSVPGYVPEFNHDNTFQIGEDPLYDNSLNGYIDDVRISNVAYEYAIPEPITAALFGLGSLFMVAKRRRS
jgi:hypothetical protein